MYDLILNEWMHKWFAVYKSPMVKTHTNNMYQYALSLIGKSEVANHRIADVTEMDLQNMLNSLAKQKYSKSTILKVRLALKQAYKVLVRNNTINFDPTRELQIPLAPKKEILPLTHQEEKLVTVACADDVLGHLIIFLLKTGLRKSEMMALKWEDYNSDDNSIFIQSSKTVAGVRKVYLVPTARSIIQRMPHINEYIFNHTRNAPITPSVMRRLVDRIRIKTNIPSFACHVCRHTFVTRLCERKVPVKAIAEIIGHARSDYVLDIYAKMEADVLRKSIYILEEGDNYSSLMGATIQLPLSLYDTIYKEAEKQHVSVDALATFLLTSVTAQK